MIAKYASLVKRLALPNVCGVFLLAQAISANAGTFPVAPKDANLLVQQEAFTEALGLVGQLVGPSPNPIPWSGTVSDDKWSLRTGFVPYNTGSLLLNYSGTYDHATDIIAWEGSLRYSIGDIENSSGSLEWTDSGSYTDASVDGFWKSIKNGFVSLAKTGLKIQAGWSADGVQGVAIAFGADIKKTSMASVMAVCGVVKIMGGQCELNNINSGAPIADSNTSITRSTSPLTLEATVTSNLIRSPLFPPFESPFPIDAPGLLLTPDPAYPGVMVVSQGLARWNNPGDYDNPGASITVEGTATVSTLVPEPDSISLVYSSIFGLIVFYFRGIRLLGKN